MIEIEWLRVHVAVHGNRTKIWDFDAKHEAVKQCLTDCRNIEMRDSALWDFWGNNMAAPLFDYDSMAVIKNIWICLESAVQDQIDAEELL